MPPVTREALTTAVELQQAGYDVVVVDNLSNSSADVIDGIERIKKVRPAFYNVDCGDIEAFRNVFQKENNIIGVIHFRQVKL